MLAVWSWLMEMVEIDGEVEAEEGARVLTAAGLEVEDISQIGNGFTGVVIAEVASKRPHPNADRLTLVELITAEGGECTEVICGAPNVPEAGGRVLWAPPGAVLPGGMQIGSKDLKGITSAGMICSERELELGDDHDGIIVLTEADRQAPLGAEAATALKLRDVVFEIGVPANRPDCLGHLGLAREMAAHLGGKLRPIQPQLDDLFSDGPSADAQVSVRIDDPAGCPRYVARIVEGLEVGRSPEWMRQRLRAVGVRPLSNLVDVTNYVMFELGQPLHAFDFARVAGKTIVVRRAKPGESMTTLDDVERQLEPSDLLICDDERPVALAGIMGGADSEVAEGAQRVLLEAANFEPLGVRRTGRRLGLNSESSYRFERQVDPNICDIASRRAAELLARLGGGRVVPGALDVYPTPAEPTSVRIRASRASALIGLDLDRGQVSDALDRLGLSSEVVDDDTLRVRCPTGRPDLTREADLIEECLRIHGFANVPATLPSRTVAPRRTRDRRPSVCRRELTGAGLSEAITFGFTSPARIAALGLDAADRRANPVRISNPMSVEQSVMRTSLLPNLLAAVARNLKYDVPDIGLFEVGSVFLAQPGQALPDEPQRVAAVLAGQRAGWLDHGGQVDFYDLKGILERMLSGLCESAATTPRLTATSDVPYLHPGVCAAIESPDGTRLGVIGEVHPETRAALEIGEPCFAFEFDLSAVSLPGPAQMQGIARYPAITRDISFFVDTQTPAQRVRDLIALQQEPLLEKVQVLEDYRDPARVPAGKKGMLWSITYRSLTRTLTDKEVDVAHRTIVDGLLAELPAKQR